MIYLIEVQMLFYDKNVKEYTFLPFSGLSIVDNNMVSLFLVYDSTSKPFFIVFPEFSYVDFFKSATNLL